MTFSIRDLLFVTMIVALAVGWWVDHRRLAAEVERQWWLQTARTSSLFHLVRDPAAPATKPPKP